MSFDSLNQYAQAQGYIKLNDWHPPIMAVIWKAGIDLTELTSSFMIFTIGTFVLGSFLLSLFIFRITNNKLLSFIPLLFLLLPNTLTFIGVVWKDVYLAAAFMLGSVCMLLGSSVHPRWNINLPLRNALIILGVGVIIFGSTFRHGVWPAFIPLLIFAAYKISYSIKIKLFIAFISILLLMSASTIISRVFNAVPAGASVVVIIDDIINISNERQIRESNLSEKSKDYLVDLQKECKSRGVRAYAAYLCDESHLGFASSISLDAISTKNFWQDRIINNPLGYLTHRTKIFVDFLIPPYIYAWQEEIDPNPYDLSTRSKSATIWTEKYVKFFIAEWPSLYKPYTWLVVIVAVSMLTILSVKKHRHSVFVLVIFTTAILFLLSFFPAAIVTDYRMTFMFVFACGLVSILYLVDSYDFRHKPFDNKLSRKNEKNIKAAHSHKKVKLR